MQAHVLAILVLQLLQAGDARSSGACSSPRVTNLPQAETRETPEWRSWWALNRAAFRPEQRLHHSRPERPPTEEQILEIEKAFQDVLEREADIPRSKRGPLIGDRSELLEAVLIALAKVDGSSPSWLAPRLQPFLADIDPGVRDSALFACAVLSDPTLIPGLAALALDSPRGRELVGQELVPARTRSLAAYGLGRIATCRGDDSARILEVLRSVFEHDEDDIDLEVVGVHALGFIDSSLNRQAPGDEPLEFAFRLLQDEERAPFVRAQAGLAATRLLQMLPPESAEPWGECVSATLIERFGSFATPAAFRRQTAFTLGRLAAGSDSLELRERIREVLLAAGQDSLCSGFALLALAESAHRADDEEIARVAGSLIAALDLQELRPWAALACGVLGWQLSGDAHAKVEEWRCPEILDEMRTRVRSHLVEKSDELGAVVLATGMLGDDESVPWLAEHLGSVPQDVQLEVAAALGLMGARVTRQAGEMALECLRRHPVPSHYHSFDLFFEVTDALARLEDPAIVPELLARLASSRSPAETCSVLNAIAITNDARAIPALLELLARPVEDGKRPLIQSYAAFALGEIGNKEPSPWNRELARDMDFVDAPRIVVDPSSGEGILDRR